MQIKYPMTVMNFICLVSLFNGISTFNGYLKLESYLYKNSSNDLQIKAGDLSGFIIFPLSESELYCAN